MCQNNSLYAPYGKRIKLDVQESNSKNILVSQWRLPMQAKENVKQKFGSHDNDDVNVNDDVEGCYVIAEIPRKKSMGSSLSAKSQITSKKNNILKNCDSRSLSLFCDIENKDSKFLNHSFNRKSSTSPPIEKKKFFLTPRNCLSQSKQIKSKLIYKNQLKKKMNLFEECYRLKEKLQYIQLLQSQTPSLFKNSQGQSNYSMSHNIPVIDLTDDSNSLSEKRCMEESLIDFKAKQKDEDVQIIREIRGVRSFDDIIKIKSLNLSEEAKPNLLTNLHNTSSSSSSRSDRSSCDSDEKEIQLLKCTKRIMPPESLEAKLHTLMQISEPKCSQAFNKHKKFALPELSPEQERLVQKALIAEPGSEILAEGFGLQITRKDVQTLKGLNWLNDEIINFYMNLIMDRSKKNSALPKVFAFNTFFYSKLVSAGYHSLKRWTKMVDVFSYDVILVPIHLGMHWCLSVIDFRIKFIKYFDSVGSPNDSCLQCLMKYLMSESLDKKNKLFDTEEWVLVNVEDTPQQMNGGDCGVFSCMFAEYAARDAEIVFTQNEMPYFRKKIIVEILNKHLLT